MPRNRCRAVILLSATLSIAVSYSASFGAEFIGLGTEGYHTFPQGISANGRVIVGVTSSRDIPDVGALFRWTPQRGVELLSEPSEESIGISALSANGRVIVGNHGGGWPLAHRWTYTSGWQPLGDLPGGDTVSSAGAVSGKGDVVVGASRVEPRAEWSSGWQAFRWTERGGMQGLGYVNSTDVESSAADVSRDGKYIVGSFTTATPNTYSFRWTKRTGMQPLAGDPGNSSAAAVSSDGRVVAGVSMGGFGPLYQAYRWTETGGMQGLGYVSVVGPHPDSAATGMTDDGSIVVGHSFDGNTDHPYIPFIWDSQTGMRAVQQVLIDDYKLGESLAGWHLLSSVYISNNGRFLAGVGRNPEGAFEGWRADLRGGPRAIPEPSTLALAAIAVAALVRAALRRQDNAFVRLLRGDNPSTFSNDADRCKPTPE